MKLKSTKKIVALAGLFFTTSVFCMDDYYFSPTRVQVEYPNSEALYFASSTHFFIISGIDGDQKTLVHCLNGTDLQETKTILENPFSLYTFSAQNEGIASYENGLVINTRNQGIKLWSITETGIREESSPLKLKKKMKMISCNGQILATQGYDYNSVTFYDLSQPEVSWNLHILGEASPYLPWDNFGKHFIASTSTRQQFYLIDPNKDDPKAKSIDSWPFDLEDTHFAMDPENDACIITGEHGRISGKREHYKITNVSSDSFVCAPITSPLPKGYYTNGIFLKENFVFEIGVLNNEEYGKPGYFTIYNRDTGNKIWGAGLRKKPMSVNLINNYIFLAYGNPQGSGWPRKYSDQEIVIFDINRFILNAKQMYEYRAIRMNERDVQ